jgi:predicted phage terminase large subunit-like protein
MVTRYDAAKELTARRAARTGLLAFLMAVRPGYEVGDHHREICDVLERVERGEIDRLIIEAPPRHGKSEIVSVHYPAWLLGRRPTWQIITVSYADELAVGFGRRVRNLVGSSSYGRVFPAVDLAQDSKAANRWHTSDGGIYLATGIGGAITGHGANVEIIDDPFKNREEADSERRRDYIWNIFTSDLQSRLMPGGAIIVMHTRWHEDDLVGRIDERAKKEHGDRYYRLTLPAIADEGTPRERALWPAWYPLEALHRMRANMQRRDWESLYQQRPQPEGGIFFQREWFRRFRPGEQPERLNKYIASDYAVTEDGGDYTEHGVWGIDNDDNMWMADWWYGQTAADVWIDKGLSLHKQHQSFAMFGEGGVIRKAVEPIFKRLTTERRIYPHVEYIASVADKPTRARAFQARASLGKVYIPYGELGDRLIDQLVRFPRGKHDDAVDVCSLMANALEMTHPAIVPVTKPPPKRSSWDLAEQGEGQSWRV